MATFIKDKLILKTNLVALEQWPIILIQDMKEKSMLENGKMELKKAKESWHGKMEINFKDYLNKII